MPDMIDHPPHYNQARVECIDIIEDLGLNFNLGNAFKYIWRSNMKGSTTEDLKKARWYLDREIRHREGGDGEPDLLLLEVERRPDDTTVPLAPGGVHTEGTAGVRPKLA
jgi:hypothetical protein